MLKRKPLKKTLKEKRQSYRFGLQAETAACWWLRCKGYQIYARRLRNQYGEIDILAKRGNVMVAVEVKARQNKTDFHHAVPPAQQARIVRTMQQLLNHPTLNRKSSGLHGELAPNMRFDVIWVRPKALPIHIIDAWRP